MKNKRKIRLQRETLIRLEQIDLKQVVGGQPVAVRAADPEPLSSGLSWCGGSCMNED